MKESGFKALLYIYISFGYNVTSSCLSKSYFNMFVCISIYVWEYPFQ